MKHIHRVQVPALQPETPSELQLSGAEVRHLQVMRVQMGDAVQVFDGLGLQGEAVVTALDGFRAVLNVLRVVTSKREYPQSVTLAIALLKGDKLSDVVRAATELGAGEFQLLTTRYGDVPDIGESKLTRLRRVAAEAAKQSQRAVIPAVLPPVPLKHYQPAGQVFFAHPGSAATLLREVSWQERVTLITGPEGGFSEEESARLATFATPLTLGPRILRAETAPLALLGALAASGL